jgi:hypothetical protein
MRRFFLALLIFTVLLFTPKSLLAEDRYTNCDACGFCPSVTPVPATWEQCRACLYPNASSDPLLKDTLRVTNNTPPTTAPGRMFTQLGCIKSDLGSFQDEGAAASVTQAILNLIWRAVGILALLYLIYGASIILTSQDNPERLDRGKKIVWGAIIGALFVIGSTFIIKLLIQVLGIPGFINTG